MQNKNVTITLFIYFDLMAETGFHNKVCLWSCFISMTFALFESLQRKHRFGCSGVIVLIKGLMDIAGLLQSNRAALIYS